MTQQNIETIIQENTELHTKVSVLEEELENVSGGELFIAVSVGVTLGIALWITMRTLVGLVDDELKRRGRRW